MCVCVSFKANCGSAAARAVCVMGLLAWVAHSAGDGSTWRRRSAAWHVKCQRVEKPANVWRMRSNSLRLLSPRHPHGANNPFGHVALSPALALSLSVKLFGDTLFRCQLPFCRPVERLFIYCCVPEGITNGKRPQDVIAASGEVSLAKFVYFAKLDSNVDAPYKILENIPNSLCCTGENKEKRQNKSAK